MGADFRRTLGEDSKWNLRPRREVFSRRNSPSVFASAKVRALRQTRPRHLGGTSKRQNEGTQTQHTMWPTFTSTAEASEGTNARRSFGTSGQATWMIERLRANI